MSHIAVTQGKYTQRKLTLPCYKSKIRRIVANKNQLPIRIRLPKKEFNKIYLYDRGHTNRQHVFSQPTHTHHKEQSYIDNSIHKPQPFQLQDHMRIQKNLRYDNTQIHHPHSNNNSVYGHPTSNLAPSQNTHEINLDVSYRCQSVGVPNSKSSSIKLAYHHQIFSQNHPDMAPSQLYTQNGDSGRHYSTKPLKAASNPKATIDFSGYSQEQLLSYMISFVQK
eukprot:364730_1